MATDQERPSVRPAPATPADLWKKRDSEPRKGPAIAPIWILVGVSVILLGVLFGQLITPSSAASASEPSRTPAPEQASSYGTDPSGGDPSPSPTPFRRDRKLRFVSSSNSTDSSGSPGDPYGLDTVRYRPEQHYATLKFPSATQLYTATDTTTSASYGTPQQADTTRVVTVYSRDSQAPQAPAGTVQYPVRQQPTTTIEGDTVQMTERGATEMRRMPSDSQTPGPVDIPASTRVSAQLNVPTDSDLLGPVRAQLLEDTCDPRTGDLAWPRGSWLTGHLEPVLFRDQRHLAFNWDYITFPNLTRRSLANSTATEDEEGHSGIAGKRNTHTWSVFRDTLIGSVANASGNILTALAQKANTNAPVIVAPGQSSGYGGQTTTVELPTIEVGRSIPFELVLTADYTADKPYDEPGWQGCRS